MDVILERVWAAQFPVYEATAAVAIAEAVEQCVRTRDRAHGGLDEPSADDDPRQVGLRRGVLDHLQLMIRAASAEVWSAHHGTVDCRCVLLMFPSPDDGDAFAMLETHNGKIHEAAVAALGLSPYPYWNHTDPPDGLDHESWRSRGAHWDEVLERAPLGWRAPAHNGLRYDLTAIRQVYPSVEEVAAAVPGIEKRLDRTARDAYTAERFPVLCPDTTDGPTAVRAVRTIREELADGTGVARLEALRGGLRARLPEEYDVAAL